MTLSHLPRGQEALGSLVFMLIKHLQILQLPVGKSSGQFLHIAILSLETSVSTFFMFLLRMSHGLAGLDSFNIYLLKLLQKKVI